MSSGVRQTGRHRHRNKDRDKQTNTQKKHYNTQSKVQLKRPAVLNASDSCACSLLLLPFIILSSFKTYVDTVDL